MVTHNYDSTYSPPIPVLEIEVSSIEDTTSKIALTALVDSGADTTFIPETHLQTIGAKRVRQATVRGIMGRAYPVDVYMIKISIGPYEFFGVRVVADKQGQTILGRNVINELIVTLNGLANVVEISQ